MEEGKGKWSQMESHYPEKVGHHCDQVKSRLLDREEVTKKSEEKHGSGQAGGFLKP